MPECRIRGNIDNQLGHLHSCTIHYLSRSIIDIEILKKFNTATEFKFEPYDTYFAPHVLYEKDVVPIELAERAREFVQSIVFDNTLKELNDTDNKPRDSIYKQTDWSTIKDQLPSILTESNTIEWTWEKYYVDIWRAVPLNLQSFITSPIFELIDYIEQKWKATKFTDIDITQLHKATWVLQRVDQHHGITPHHDEATGRKIAFIYYLTPDDWDSRKDGG